MLLMAGVLFGFMYCNRNNKPDNDSTSVNKTEQTTANSQTADSASVAALTPDFEKRIATVVRDYGVNDGQGTFTLKTENVILTTTTDDVTHIQGSVNLGGKEFNVSNIFNAGDTTLTLAQKADVSKILNGIYNERVKYREFSHLLGESPAKPFKVSNGKMTVTFDPRGGRMTSVTLKDYKNENTDPAKDVELFNATHSNYSFIINTGDREISTADLTFVPTVSADSTKVTMKLDLSADTWMAFTYTLVPDQYIVRLDVTQKNMSAGPIPANVTEMGFDWQMDLERNEVGRTFEERNSTMYYKMANSSPDDLNANKEASKSVNGDIQWVAFKNQFFSTVVIPRGSFRTAEMTSTPIDRDSQLGKTYVKNLSLKSTFEYSSTKNNAFGFDFYLGPNSYRGLSKVDDILETGDNSLDLQKLVPLGWGIFGWINRFIVIPLFNLLQPIGSYGLIILILTIIIKIILFPFTYKSYMSQAKMRVLAPEIKAINEKYPGQENAMKRQQETMKLYSRAGASPFSGCLPMLLQLPVLIALFNFFPSAIELRGQSFLWAHNLAAPDYICSLPFAIPFYGDKVSLFCLLMTVTNIIYTRITMASNPTSTDMPGMKWMTYLMPVMFLFFFNDYASGLSYYYFLSLLITITQTYICRKVVNEDKVRAQMMENAKKPKKKKGFMARLEEAQKRQEAMMREQAKQRAKRR